MSGPKPKWLDDNYGRVRKSKKQEQRIASKIGGKRIPRSGGLPWSNWLKNKTSDGDISTKEFHVEHKSTEHASISIKKEWLNKVAAGARSSMKDPALVVTFEKGLDQPEDWVMIPISVFERLIAKHDDEE